jgi:hypothetical protein
MFFAAHCTEQWWSETPKLKLTRRIFEGNEAAIYEGMGKALLEGRAYDFSVLADRAYGKIKDKHELSSPDGEAIRLLVKVVKPPLKDPG